MHKSIVPTSSYTGKSNYKPANNRIVRCSLCGRAIPFAEAYCVIKGPKKLYYCSREEYEGGEEYVQRRDKYEYGTEKLVKNILSCDGFDEAQYNSMMISWLKCASAEKIFYFLADNEEKFRALISSKGINNNSSKLKYLSAVVLNRVVDYEVKKSDTEKPGGLNGEVDYNNYHPKLTPRAGLRRSLEELEDEYKS